MTKNIAIARFNFARFLKFRKKARKRKSFFSIILYSLCSLSFLSFPLSYCKNSFRELQKKKRWFFLFLFSLFQYTFYSIRCTHIPSIELRFNTIVERNVCFTTFLNESSLYLSVFGNFLDWKLYSDIVLSIVYVSLVCSLY